MQISSGLRDILGDAIDTECGATAFARFYTAALATLLASAACSNPAFGSSSGGDITLSGTPQDTTPAAAGTCTRLGIYKTTAATSALWVLLFGVATGGAPDVTMSNNVIATSDTVQVSSLVVTVPAGTPDVT